jgi:predicted alpha/beta-fold hydrolase
MSVFVPRPRLAWGHSMTPAPEERLFPVTPDTQVLAHCYWQKDRRAHPTLIGLHGLEGSSTAHYMRGIAHKALRARFNVVLLNQRNCGGTEHLGPGLYHSGLTDDPAFVIKAFTNEGLDRIVVAGYSLGGNLALKVAGEHTPAELPALKAVCAVSPVLELEQCVRALERRSNFIYQWNFVRNLKARMRRKDRCWPGRFALDALPRVRTVREFDALYTAPYFGFGSAEDYYHRAAAMRVVPRIQVPALIITAADDPFVPLDAFRDPALTANPNIRLIVTEHGGHCGFLGPASGEDDDGYWAEKKVVGFAQQFA